MFFNLQVVAEGTVVEGIAEPRAETSAATGAPLAPNEGILTAKPGVLERGARAVRVEHLSFDRTRVGHVRQLTPDCFRWVIYEPGGDCIGDEPTRASAMRRASYYWANYGAERQQVGLIQPSSRTWSPSSRKPGSGPAKGTTYRVVDALSPEERTARGLSNWNELCAERARRIS